MANRALTVGIATVLGVAMLVVPFRVQAQQAAKVSRIGYITVPSRETAGGVA